MENKTTDNFTIYIESDEKKAFIGSIHVSDLEVEKHNQNALINILENAIKIIRKVD